MTQANEDIRKTVGGFKMSGLLPVCCGSEYRVKFHQGGLRWHTGARLRHFSWHTISSHQPQNIGFDEPLV